MILLRNYTVAALLLLLTFVNASAEVNNRKGIEKKFDFIEFKFREGNYPEALNAAGTLVKSLDKSEDATLADKVKSRLYIARCAWYTLDFSKTTSLENEVVNLLNSGQGSAESVEASILYINYLLETGNVVAANSCYEKIVPLVSTAKVGLQLEAKSALAFLLYKQGFYKQALTAISEIESQILQQGSNAAVETDLVKLQNAKLDFTRRKEAYAALINLKANTLLAYGSYDEADKTVLNNETWIKTNLNGSHYLLRDALVIDAEVKRILGQYEKSALLYNKAYGNFTMNEAEFGSIAALTKTVILFKRTEQVVFFQKYHRRLQMYAFRFVGPKDIYEFPYEYSSAYVAFLNGDYLEAQSRLENLKSTFEFIPDHHIWKKQLNELWLMIAAESGDIRKVDEQLGLLIKSTQKNIGENSVLYHQALLLKAIEEIAYGKNFSLAENTFHESYDKVVAKQLNFASMDNIHYLENYSSLYFKRDLFDSANTRASQASEAALKLYGENSAEYQLRLSRYAECLMTSGKYEEAVISLNKAFTLSQKATDAETETLEDLYQSLAKLFSFIGEYKKSEDLLTKASGVANRKAEAMVLREAESAEQLSSLYIQTGYYFKANKLLSKSLAAKEGKAGNNSPVLLSTLGNLVKLNLITGNYNVADKFLERYIALTDSVYGKNSINYAECLNEFGDFYLSIGDYVKSLSFYEQASKIQEKKLGKKNIIYAVTISKIAFVKNKMPDKKNADIEKLYQEAGDIIRNGLGSENPLYAEHIEKLAEFYIEINNPDKADRLLSDAEAFWRSKLGDENKYRAEILLLRGDIAYNKSKYDDAMKYYGDSRDLFSKIFNDNNIGYITAVGRTARVSYMKKDVDKAISTMETILPKYLDFTVKFFPTMSFREKSKYWSKMKEEFEFYNAIALNQAQSKSEIAGHVYDNTISTKALLLSSDIKIRERILSSNDSTLIGFYNEWTDLKEFQSNISSYSKQELIEQGIDPEQLEMQIQKLEKDMASRSEEFSQEDVKEIPTWHSVKSLLSENEYAVEMIRYRYFDKKFTDSVIYAALVINKHSEKPEVVIIGNGNQLENRYLKYYRNATIYKRKDEYSYKNFWLPLTAVIKPNSTVYFSSEGAYNQINLETLVYNDSYVIDQNNIVLVSNTKDLLKGVASKKVKENKKESQIYFLSGNPEFYEDKREGKVPTLPGAEEEVNQIDKILVSAGKICVKLVKNNVTEDSLKSVKNPKVFHIATHGYFKEATSSDPDAIGSNPLLNSGLMLANGGELLEDEDTFVNEKDGILTAYEAMNLPLDRTELVVLSACETGRGEVQSGEGVYGLQRAFLIAGSDAVIMSLFKVNDEVTQKLMTLFYENWLKTGDKRQAFIDAKKQIKKEYDSTLYWGAFIMIEGRPIKSAPKQIAKK